MASSTFPAQASASRSFSFPPSTRAGRITPTNSTRQTQVRGDIAGLLKRKGLKRSTPLPEGEKGLMVLTVWRPLSPRWERGPGVRGFLPRLAAAAAAGHLDLAPAVRPLDRLEVALMLGQVATFLGGQLDHLVGRHAPLVLVLAAGAGLVQVLAAWPPERRRRQLDLRLLQVARLRIDHLEVAD